jgi:hypothetical protein
MSEGNNTMEYPILQPSAPQAPKYEKNKQKDYYKKLSKSYKEDNHDLYTDGLDLMKKNKKLTTKYLKMKEEKEKLNHTMKDINLSLLQEMENNAILESKLVLSNRKYEKIKKQVRKQNENLLQYCYIPKKINK